MTKKDRFCKACGKELIKLTSKTDNRIFCNRKCYLTKMGDYCGRKALYKFSLCKCGCGKSVQAPNQMYFNRQHCQDYKNKIRIEKSQKAKDTQAKKVNKYLTLILGDRKETAGVIHQAFRGNKLAQQALCKLHITKLMKNGKTLIL